MSFTTEKLNYYSMTILAPSVKRVSVNDHSYAALKHETEYKIKLQNDGGLRTDVTLTIDGESVGKFRLDPYSSFVLERPQGAPRKFTFMKETSSEAREAGVVAKSSENGVVKAVFVPEKQPEFMYETAARISTNSLPKRSRNKSGGIAQHCFRESAGDCDDGDDGGHCKKMSMSLSSGATVLGGKSDQTFRTVGPITEYDHSKTTTLFVRMVVDEDKKYVSLKSVATPSSNTLPPRVETQTKRGGFWSNFFG